MKPFSFTVPGEPIPKARARIVNGHAYTPRTTQQYERLVQLYALKAKVKKLEGPIKLTMRFYRSTKRRVDLDNLEKAVADSLNRIAWGDDCQLVEQHSYKAYDKDNPRVEITIESVCLT